VPLGARKSIILALGGLCAAACVVLLTVYDPATTAFFPRCPLYSLTGLRCSGCGSQRALHELLTGHVVSALRTNVLVTLFCPFIAYSMVSHMVRSWIWPRWPRVFLPPRAIYGLICVIIVFGVGRNLLSLAHSHDAPPHEQTSVFP
jgi:hypothetical protein